MFWKPTHKLEQYLSAEVKKVDTKILCVKSMGVAHRATIPSHEVTQETKMFAD